MKSKGQIGEYFIELILMGVPKLEYSHYIRNISITKKFIFQMLNRYRNIGLFKLKVDKVRGKLNTVFYIAEEMMDYKLNTLINWIQCSCDFMRLFKRL